MAGPTPVLQIDINAWKDMLGLNGTNNKKGSVPTPTTTASSETIARIPDTTPNGAGGVADKYRNVYTEADEDEDLDANKRRQAEIDSSFTDNPDEWSRRYRYWNWNLAQDNPRGNLNGMAFRDTAFRSRLADALNNERHLKPTDIGRRTLNYGATGTGADNAGSERWEPIETQEMRQMRANERLDERARGYDIDRQKRIEDYPQQLREQMDKINQDLAKYAAQTGIDTERAMQRAIQAAEYSGSWNTFWNTLQTQFAQEYGLDISERVFNRMASMDDYVLQQMYAYYKAGIQVPSSLMKDFYEWFDGVRKRAKENGASAWEVVANNQAALTLYNLFGANNTQDQFNKWSQ